MLRVHSLHFAFGKKTILKDISFQVAKTEIVALIGISGSGKTTLFRLIAGLLPSTSGIIEVAGHTTLQRTKSITYLRQEDLLLPWRTVMGNLVLFTELGAKSQKNKFVIQNEALKLLERVGLKGVSNAYPHELSGGMRQRVALARALLQNNPVLLLDEPFCSLDVIIREELYTLIREIRDQYQKTILMVTHDFRDATSLADRVLVLSRGHIVKNLTIDEEIRDNPVALNEITQEIRQTLAASA